MWDLVERGTLSASRMELVSSQVFTVTTVSEVCRAVKLPLWRPLWLMGGVEIYLHTFLTSVLDGGEWANSTAFPAWRHQCTCWIGGWGDFWGREIYCGPTGVTALSQFLFVSFWRDSPPPPVGHGILIHEVSRSHNDAVQSVGLLWTSDQLVAETSSLQHKTLTADKLFHASGGIRTYNLNRRAAADVRLRPRGYWKRHGEA